MPPKYKLVTTKKLLRNDGVGDYYQLADGSWNVVATEMTDSRHTNLILLHELVETMLIQDAGIPEEVVTAFDAYFEVKRKCGLVSESDEPGDDPQAPYYRQHQIATQIERLMCENGYFQKWEDCEISVIEKLKQS